ncbi:MAG TPA: imidazolonepropionase, partial [Amphiplicatus sp.]|nr:imidazolonepropionase [Amphiplicatus sp.]
RLGVTTVEIKSGYGLTADAEFRMLEAATAAGRATGVRVLRTFLGLHALPTEFANDRAGYVRLVAEEMLPAAFKRGLVDAVDAFCEGIGFSTDEVRQVFEAAANLALPVKLHAEQLSDLGGAGLAAQFNALSADHLEYVNESDVAAMAKSGAVAVLLPGAFYFLKEKTKPPVDLFRKHGVRMALASDLNPGTSPLFEPGLVMNMGCTFFGLTPEEALVGMTRHAAAALGLSDKIGVLEVGKAADFAVWDIAQPAELCYWIGGKAPERVFIAGRELASA